MSAKPRPSVYHGHLVLVSTFVFNTVAIGAFNVAGLYLGPLAESFPDYGTATIAYFYSFQIVAALCSSYVGGVAQDWLDSKGIGLQWLFFGGGVFMALGFIWSSFSNSIYGVLVGSMLFGCGIGFGGFMAGAICVLWYEEARAMMLLFASSGQGVGGVFFAWATAKLLEMNDDLDDPWRPTMRWIGVLCFVLCAIASFPMRMPLPGEVEKYEKGGETENSGGGYGSMEAPSNTGVRQRGKRSSVTALENVRKESGRGRRQSTLFQGGQVKEQKRVSMMLGSFAAVSKAPLLSLSDFAGDEADEDLGALLDGPGEESTYSLKEVTWTRTNIFLNVFSILASFAIMNMNALLPPYVASLGMPPLIGGRVLQMFSIGDFLSNLTLGVVADQIGSRRLLTAAFFILSGLFFVWPHSTTPMSISIVAFFDGYFTCTITSLPLIILADAFSESSSEHILTLNGMINMVKFPGYLLGPSLACHVVDWQDGSYSMAAIWSGILTMAGTVMLLLVPSPEEQQRQLEEIKR